MSRLRRLARHPALRYWLIQLPEVLLVAALAVLAVRAGLIGTGTAALLFLLWTSKDAVLCIVFVRAERAGHPLGRDALVHARGEVVTPIAPEHLGQVRIHGELWRARSAEGRHLAAGERIRVLGVEGMTVYVLPAEPP